MSDIVVVSVFLVCLIIFIPIYYMIGELKDVIGQRKNKNNKKELRWKK